MFRSGALSAELRDVSDKCTELFTRRDRDRDTCSPVLGVRTLAKLEAECNLAQPVMFSSDVEVVLDRAPGAHAIPTLPIIAKPLMDDRLLTLGWVAGQWVRRRREPR